MKRAYVCSPFRAETEEKILRNIGRAIQWGEWLRSYKKSPAIPHLASVSRYGLYGNNKKVTILDDMLLGACDVVYVFGKRISDGMRHEIELSQKLKIKIKYVP